MKIIMYCLINLSSLLLILKIKKNEIGAIINAIIASIYIRFSNANLKILEKKTRIKKAKTKSLMPDSVIF